MRRITLKHAKPGMVVEAPVYDNWGNLIIYKDNELTAPIINSITERGISEVLIRDWRVTDVLIVPLFAPQNEGTLASFYRQLVLELQSTGDFSNQTFNDVRVALINMTKDMDLNIVGDLNVTCNIRPDDYAFLQPVKTAGVSLAIGRCLGLKPEQMLQLGIAALFKDIGLPVEIMDSVDLLSEGASPRVKDHPVNGCNILNQKKLVDQEVITAILHHHEQWNGAGYPSGFKGQQISKLARILSMADTYIDLMTARPGRNKYMPHEAIEYIMAFGGDQFDPELVETFVRQIPSYPSGLSVQLNTGDTGIVCDPKMGFVARPIVRVCYRPVKGLLKQPIDVDLSHVTYQRMLITKVLEYD
jgi:HD-GYP domain-containing protein (c-di-GMP phosphodiesterase class II)